MNTPAEAMMPEPWEVIEHRVETYDTFTLVMKPVAPTSRFQFSPGQFNMLYVLGVGEVPISISSDCQESKHIHHTIRNVGYVTDALRKLKPGSQLGLRGPYGSAWPIETAHGKDLIIMTGGIGLAPLRPVVYHVAKHRDKFDRVYLLYGSRSPDDLLYPDECQDWKDKYQIDVRITVDSASPQWLGNVGVVTRLLEQIDFDPLNSVAMLCGPEIMMRFSALELQDRGLKEKQLILSMERNMKCAIGFCGHCQYGPHFICKDGAVFNYATVKDLLKIRDF